MMKRTLLLLLAIAALVAWFAWPSRTTEGPLAAEPDALSEPNAAAARADDDPSALAGELVRAATAPEAEAASELPAAAAPERQLTVRVVTGSERTPAAGAAVILEREGGSNGLDRSESLAYRDANFDQQLDHWGRRFACDAAGIARVPLPEAQRFRIAAQQGDAWARADLRANELAEAPEVLLVLAPALHLRVLVTDEQGAPQAGIPVAYSPANQDGRGHYRGTTLTDESGLAHLRHLQEERMRQEGSAKRHLVALALPLDPPVTADFAPEAPPQEPILLILPATGAVEVEVLELDGSPVSTSHNVELQRLRPDADPNSRPGEMMLYSWLGRATARTEGGRVRFERVGLGLMLEIGVDFERSRIFERLVAPGPQHPGETVRLTLRRSGAAPRISGRMVNDAGEPIAGGRWTAEILPADSDRRIGNLELRTGADGRFDTPFGLPDAAGLVWLWFHEESPGRSAHAIAPLRLPLPPGVTELGDLGLGAPLLASFQVLDRDSQPLAGARGSFGQVDAGQRIQGFHRGPFQDLSWTADKDGCVVLSGAFPDGRYRLELRAGGGVYCPPLDFAPGARSVELRCTAPPGVSGRVLLDEGLPAEELFVLLEDTEGGTGTRVFSDGSFRLAASRPGSHDLVLSTAHQGIEILRRSGLDLPTKQTAIELGELDLRGRLLGTRVSLRALDGTPISQARLSRLRADGDDQTPPWARDFPAVLLSVGVERCLVSAEGYEDAELALDGVPKILTLTPAPR